MIPNTAHSRNNNSEDDDEIEVKFSDIDLLTNKMKAMRREIKNPALERVKAQTEDTV